jgi:protein SCO1
MRNVFFVKLALLAASSSLALAACAPPGGQQAAGANPECFRRSTDEVGGPFELVAQDGRTLTQKAFAGRKTLVFFGYTYCPDICPITLYNVGRAMQAVPADKRPATLFISVDPARDTPETIAQYIRSNGFPEDITGLTGTEAQLTAATDAFKTSFGRGDPSESAGGYLVSHSSLLYLMDETWKLQTFFTQDDSADAIATCIAALS